MISYTQKNFLVVDDFTEFRNSIKGMLRQIGALNVDVATTGEETIQMCRKKKFDIILHDYNLGPGKNGQQVLEELILQKLLSPHTIFIMVTAENSLAMVMGAVEYEPDDYLTKPFNRAALLQRLDRLVERRETMEPINAAADKGQWAEMIRACDELMQSNRRYAALALRKKAYAMQQLNQRKPLETMLRDIIQQRPVPWALIMLGRLLLTQGDATQVEALMNDAIQQFPQLPGLYDVLAEAQILLGQTNSAQMTIQEALKTSPRAIRRQMQLGTLAKTNGDLDVAIRAYRDAVDMGRGSCLKTPDNYINFVNLVNEQVTQTGSGTLDRRFQEESMHMLSEVNKDYSDDKSVLVRSYLGQAQTLKNSGKARDADQWARRAVESIKGLPYFFSSDIAMEVVKQLTDMGQGTAAQQVMSTCAEMYGDDPKIQQALAQHEGGQELVDRINQARQLNKAGASLYERRQFVEAMQPFRDASNLQPRNITIVLNAVQNLLQVMQQQPNQRDTLKQECVAYLNKLNEMSPGDSRYERFQKLRRLAMS